MNRKYLTMPEVAEQLNVCYETVRRYIKAKKLEAIKVGGEFRVLQENIDTFLESCKVE